MLWVRGNTSNTRKPYAHGVSLPKTEGGMSYLLEAEFNYKLLTFGMILGGDVRVEMEDNIYLAKGVLAKSNAELVTKVVKIARN